MPATSEEPISAIIPTVGRADALERCLHSILRQTQGVAEVVIVHCSDDAQTMAMAASPQWLTRSVARSHFHVLVSHAEAFGVAFAEANAHAVPKV
jgi:glycosyltransferase involved in cell wall biosynthesis